MQPNPNTRDDGLQEQIDKYYELLTESRRTESNSLTDQFCGFVDLIKSLVERRAAAEALTALDQLKQLLSLVRDRLDFKDPKREANHAELLELSATHTLPISSAIIESEITIMEGRH